MIILLIIVLILPIIILIIVFSLKGTVQDFAISLLRRVLSPPHMLRWPECSHVLVLLLVILIIVFALKGTVQDFTILLCPELSLPHMFRWPEYSHVQITCNTLSTDHMQHLVYHVVWRDSSAIKFDRV